MYTYLGNDIKREHCENYYIPVYNKNDDCINNIVTASFNPAISCKNSNFINIAQERIGFDDLKFYLTYKR